MYIVPLGNIAPGIWYQVQTDTITYNGTTYNIGDYFQGVDGFTDYTGSGEVIYASSINAIAVPYEVPPLYYSPNNLFIDESEVSVISAGIGPTKFNAKLTRSGACESEATIVISTNYFEI